MNGAEIYAAHWLTGRKPAWLQTLLHQWQPLVALVLVDAGSVPIYRASLYDAPATTKRHGVSGLRSSHQVDRQYPVRHRGGGPPQYTHQDQY